MQQYAQEIPHNDNDVDTVIVGAGPIGLLNAIGLLTKNRKKKLVILERYETYQRDHVLRVDYRQLEKYLKACGNKDPVLQELVKQTQKNKFIPINELEKALKAQAIKLGADIRINNNVTDFAEQVIKKFPNADLIIGADGTRSVVSEQAIGKSYAFYEMTEQNKDKLQPGKMYFEIIDGRLTYSVITPDGNIIKNIGLYKKKELPIASPVNEKSIKFFPSRKDKEEQLVPSTTDPFAISSIDMKKIHDMKNEILAIAAENGHIKIESNSEKREFDFALQLRLKVEGKAQKIQPITLASVFQNYGITGNEYVGIEKNGITPITFQLIITKKQYQLLSEHAKSKKPIMPFSADDNRAELIPKALMQQIKSYLGLRIGHFNNGEIVRLDTATISVNELPATYAKTVTTRLNYGNKKPDVVVIGDAALGLSFFKGINSGFESSAKLLECMDKSYDERQNALANYRQWFEAYAEAKVKEVARFSTYAINSFRTFFKVSRFVSREDFFMSSENAARTVDLYRGYLHHIAENPTNLPKWRNTYPHNHHPLENTLSFRANDSSKIFTRARKNFSDIGKPYKSTFYFLRDLVAPLRSAYQLSTGVLKIVMALPAAILHTIVNWAIFRKSLTDNLAEQGRELIASIQEGVARILLGCSLAITSILMPVKLISRSSLTLVYYHKNQPFLIENNTGIRKLLASSTDYLKHNQKLSIFAFDPEIFNDAARELLEKNKNRTNSPLLMFYELHSISLDLHRKFQKATHREQKTAIDPIKEQQLFKTCIINMDMQSYNSYISLFKTANQTEPSSPAAPNMEI